MIRRTLLLAGLLASCARPAAYPPNVHLSGARVAPQPAVTSPPEPLAPARDKTRPPTPTPAPAPLFPYDPAQPYPRPDPALPPDSRAT